MTAQRREEKRLEMRPSDLSGSAPMFALELRNGPAGLQLLAIVHWSNGSHTWPLDEKDQESLLWFLRALDEGTENELDFKAASDAGGAR